jgi:signal transduction histidine kinase/CheY-like chemotaxis protein
MRITKDNEVLGVLGVDYLLDPIAERVGKYAISDGGYGILMSGSFDVLAFPQSGYVGRKVDDLPGYQGVGEKLLGSGENVLAGIDGGKYAGHFARLENGWYLGVITRPYWRQMSGLIPAAAAFMAAFATALCFILPRGGAVRHDGGAEGSSLLSRLSHEIRTPLNAMAGMCEIASRERDGHDARQYASEIKSAGESLVAVMDDILGFTAEREDLGIRSESYQTGALFGDVASIARASIGEKPLDLVASVDPDIPRALLGDEARVRQILLNLLSNAARYTGEGFVKLEVLSRCVGRKVTLRFRVTGSGMEITGEDMGTVFGDLAGLDLKNAGHAVGTGLGLSVSKRLCRAMGGDVTVERDGDGVSFSATINQDAADWRSTDSLPDAGVPQHNGDAARRIRALVVDDMETQLVAARGMMAPYRLSVSLAPGGREALELARKTNFDLVFIDYMMPEMDGIETAHALRGLGEHYAKARLIALTADATDGMEEFFLSNGFDYFLQKPIEPDKLGELMGKLAPGETALRPAREGSFHRGVPGLEIDGLDTVLGLRLIGGSRKNYLDALRIFCRDAQEKLSLIEKTAYDNSNDFAMAVHSLKGALAYIGATDLSEESASLEKYARRGMAERRIGGFIGRVKKLTASITEALDRESSADGAYAAAQGAECLPKLKKALDERDIGLIDATLEELGASSFGRSAAHALSSISDHVLVSNFEEAAGVAGDLLKEVGI